MNLAFFNECNYTKKRRKKKAENKIEKRGVQKIFFIVKNECVLLKNLHPF